MNRLRFNFMDEHVWVITTTIIIIIIIKSSLTLFCHLTLWFIVLGKSSRQHLMSTWSWFIWVLAGWPTLAWLCIGVHKTILFMSSFLLLQQYSMSCLAYEIGGEWLYSCYFVRYCLQDFFKTVWTSLFSFYLTFSSCVSLKSR